MINTKISLDELEEWFDRYGVADIPYREREGHDFRGYQLQDYEQDGYDRDLIMENLAGGAWDETVLNDGYFRYRHQDFWDYPIEISDDELWLYIPELKDAQYREMKAILAGGPPGTWNGQRAPPAHSMAIMELEELFHWALPSDD